MHNPWRLCHVVTYTYIHGNMHIILYADKSVSVREVYGNLAKTKALRSTCSSSLLPTLRRISGSAYPTASLVCNFRLQKSEQRFAAILPYATLVSEY